MHFTKMHGLGNDYLYVFGEVPENIVEISKKLSDRHFGVGSDGMIYIGNSSCADFKMRIFNADGSEAKMCGNGIRCVAKYVYDKGYTDKKYLTVETLSGIKKLDLEVVDGKVKNVSVNMGISKVESEVCLDAFGKNITLIPVNMGNPHAVVFVPNADEVPITQIGPFIEKSPLFPGGVNVEFVNIIDENTIRMRVWERGSGVTMACGTGACASTAAAVKKGFCKASSPVAVMLDGGKLSVSVDEMGEVLMTGPAEFICEGDAL